MSAKSHSPNGYIQTFIEISKGKSECSLRDVVKYLQTNKYDGPIKFYVTLLDTNHTNKMTQNMFIKLMELLEAQNDLDRLPTLIFKAIDSDNSGYIERNEIEPVMSNARKFGAQDLYECLREVGQRITVTDFCTLVRPIYEFAQDSITHKEVVNIASKMFDNKSQGRKEISIEEAHSLVKMLGAKSDVELYTSFADVDGNNKVDKVEFVHLATVLKEYLQAFKHRRSQLQGVGLNDPESFCITARFYFKMLDNDENGVISPEELCVGASKFKNMEEGDVLKNAQKYVEESGCINFEVFKKCLQSF
ncbi:hypothetical protein EIN_280710 [Entamoeba invadens IP1]|uniref:EF-hand domain-containing protein n=1 Tax=Entamoeba invadens IP1 TaxID=370355 RepID=A0A0A1U7U6_ENTIV|nr:hypothetical protein EIN_280710 [Entamoeba invadens IP1]ELP91004.1 hypothetical protein EIN_280710 [Entamoeba invadens IP1]|eukprot:XP_004257775.1 hypothetical protein EIN_280710 [Entamoeba invadens IP1]